MILRFLRRLRRLRLGAIFAAIQENTHGAVLDVGGRTFFQYIVADKDIEFTSWTCLEQAQQLEQEEYADPRYKMVIGDGERMLFDDSTFDTVLNIQVLEHTLRPERMVSEMARVLKSDGRAIFLIPQTSALHEVPTHYYNFTKYWVQEIFPTSGFEIIKLIPLGGRWGTHASHMLHFFLEAFRIGDYSSSEYKRNSWFYILFPFMALYAAFGVVMGMIFALGDLTEDPNNILVIAKKRI